MCNTDTKLIQNITFNYWPHKQQSHHYKYKKKTKQTVVVSISLVHFKIGNLVSDGPGVAFSFSRNTCKLPPVAWPPEQLILVNKGTLAPTLPQQNAIIGLRRLFPSKNPPFIKRSRVKCCLLVDILEEAFKDANSAIHRVGLRSHGNMEDYIMSAK